MIRGADIACFIALFIAELVMLSEGRRGAPAADSWWTFGINFLQAVGTLGAVAVALFGKWLQAKLFPPRLELRLRSAQGDLGKRMFPNGFVEQDRWYHMRVSNGRRWSPVRSVRVMLVRIERLDPSTGAYQLAWEGETPMRWEHQEFNSPVRTIGPSGFADLFHIAKSGVPELAPQYASFNVPRQFNANETVILSLEARGDEVSVRRTAFPRAAGVHFDWQCVGAGAITPARVDELRGGADTRACWACTVRRKTPCRRRLAPEQGQPPPRRIAIRPRRNER